MTPLLPTRRQAMAVLGSAAAAGLCTPARAQDTGGDPLGTLQWPDVRRAFLGQEAFRFDERVLVRAPRFAEDAMNVPVLIDATALGPSVRRIVMVADRNPIRQVLEYRPHRMQPRLAFRFKLQQASAMRALVQTGDGMWHVGSTLIEASGGGCTLPGASRADGSWSSTLGQVQAQVLRDFLDQGHARLRLRVMHPMDTGLVSGIPAYYIERLQATDPAGELLFEIALFEPVSENPLLTFDFPGAAPASLHITGRDTSAFRIDARVRS